MDLNEKIHQTHNKGIGVSRAGLFKHQLNINNELSYGRM